MILNGIRNRIRVSGLLMLGLLSGIGPVLLAPGCVPVDGGDNGNENATANDNSGSTGFRAEIVNILANFAVSQSSAPFSVLYNVTGTPDSVRGYYQPVSGFTSGAEPIGDPVFITGNLPAGSNQQFSFDPRLVAVGNYRIGVHAVDGSQEADALSTGVVQVQGPPNPRFVQPSQSITEVAEGATLTVSFDAGDPENFVQWRLFYLRSTDSRTASPDQLGTQLAVGSGNVGQFPFSTVGLEEGDYELGLSATDSGSSVASTAQQPGGEELIVTIPNVEAGVAGPVIRVVSPQSALPPLVAITNPGTANVTLFRDEPFNIQYTVTIREAEAVGSVDVFYDTDTNFGNGYTLIESELPATITQVALPAGLPEGTYRIGVAARDGVNPVVFVYAAGSVSIIRTPTLTVSQPNTNLPIAPSSPTGAPITVPVVWSTNVPAGSNRTVDVYAQAVNSMGNPAGNEILVMSPRPLTTTSTVFSSQTSGLFAVFVRLRLGDGSAPLVVESPQRVRVSALPRILWVGSLAEEEPAFEGAIFGGVNYEDNAGSTVSPAGDLNGDGLGDFVVAARYGKPFFENPSGVGPGEAYLLYGGAGARALLGPYNLNSVGTAGLRGVTLTGVRTVNNTDNTDGLSDVTLVPDADGDGIGELVFGFPRTNSASVGPLCAAGQFLAGGVVILSSTTTILGAPDAGTPVVNLDLVGQAFTDQTVDPDPETQVLDSLVFQAGPPAQCAEGTDGVLDTIVGPGEGFVPALAPPSYTQIGFTPLPPNTPPAMNVCATQFDVPVCDGVLGGTTPGSGFYPATSMAEDPQGARIIGQSAGDAFGTSVAFSDPVEDSTPGQLIISSPNRNATAAEIDALDGDISGAGVAYLNDNRVLWGRDSLLGTGALPPFPHQYVVGTVSNCGAGREQSGDTTLRVAGEMGDRIENITGLEDFNRDGRNDFAVGAPRADSARGRVYIAFRREEAIEGDFILGKLRVDPNDPERLDGVLIVTGSEDGLGSALATGVDFNADGFADLVIGSPNANGGIGEVVIVFGDPNLVSPLNGVSVQTLLTTRTMQGRPRAARITGNALDAGGLFGFNIANAGDVDGDGKNDLLIAAPNGSPRFDSNPTDNMDVLTEPGLDQDFDGVKDDVSGPLGFPDGTVNANDDLPQAGIVYVISSRNNLGAIPRTDVTVSISELGGNLLRGFMIVGRRAGDRIGGGDAGNSGQGGIAGKAGRGRSLGLSTAGDVDGDRRADILIGSILADPRRDPNTGVGVQNGGEAYLIYGSAAP